MATNGHPSRYACQCLNVRIRPQPPPDGPPSTDNEFEPVYVGDEGLSVAHKEVTLRNRSRPTQTGDGESSQWTRHTSLTCLLCQTLIYRITQSVSPDVENGEGPVLPTDDWAEQDVLKSATGWIEVSKSCITGEVVVQAESSSAYSRTFNVILPSMPLPSSATTSYLPPSSISPRTPTESPNAHLPPLPPLFLPPPFTPSHAVFTHLSTLAIAESKKVRDTAEEYITKITEEKVAEIKAVEVQLKREVEVLWSRFREGLEKVHQDISGNGRPTSMLGRRHSSARWAGLTSPGAGSSAHETASVRINDFVPVQIPTPRMSGTGSPRQMTSALSASLATSSFHHPRAQEEAGAAISRDGTRVSESPSHYRSTSPSPSRSSTTRVMSPSIASSRTMAMPINGESSTIREAYRRNMDQSKDVATSFRYVLDLEAQMEAARTSPIHAQQEEPAVAPQSDSPQAGSPPRGRSPKISKSSIKKPKPNSGSASQSQEKRSGSQRKATEDDKKEGSSRGKRHVTFDVQPEVAIIGGDSTMGESKQGEEETIFDMDGEDRSESANAGLKFSLALNGINGKHEATDSEPIVAPVRQNRRKISNDYGLPSSLQALRPASLPTMSNVRPPVLRQVSADRPQAQALEEAPVSTQEESGRRQINGYRDTVEMAEDVDPREAEILRLVAASTPSHRSAWHRGSKAWELFVNRQDKRNRDIGPVAIAEEEEGSSSVEYTGPRLGGYVSESESESGLDDEERDRRLSSRGEAPISSSLPIPISHNQQTFNILYQPKTSLTERPGVLVPPLRRVSPRSVRRAVYAERDRTRSIDPGALDFTSDVDDRDDEADVNTGLEVGSRARALRILESRDALPAAGMWRSLA
ncbi:hypothetical protein AcW1_004437 [Taiwanofungus camphoratus]|nr:hypothetical protein AcW2_006557 [Antrodia cinnamomea]KAI0959677.1 hypothetical protein AcW1_004437 [Antrodia cinnamomea]